MLWNSDTTTYYDRGRRAYRKGDVLPDEVVSQMGDDTILEYLELGHIVDDEEVAENQREELYRKAVEFGLKPHHNAGIEKLSVMLDDYEALLELKKEALSLGIDPRDDVTYEELRALIDELDTEE